MKVCNLVVYLVVPLADLSVVEMADLLAAQ